MWHSYLEETVYEPAKIMALPITWRIALNVNGFAQAERILHDVLVSGLEGLGKLLVQSVRPRMREFEGKEKASVRYKVTGKGLDLHLTVFSTLVQAFIDELGLPPGTFQPYGINSRIYRYARRKGMENRARDDQHNFNVRRPARRVSHVRSRSPRGHRSRIGGSPRGPLTRVAKPVRTGDKPARQRQIRDRKARLKANALRRIAFLVARAIFERGIKAGGPFRKTLEANQAQIVAQVRNAFIRAVNKINKA